MKTKQYTKQKQQFIIHTSHVITHYILHNAHCKLYTAKHMAHCKLRTADITLHTAQHSAHCTQNTSHCILHTTDCTLHTTHYTQRTAHSTLQARTTHIDDGINGGDESREADWRIHKFIKHLLISRRTNVCSAFSD